MWKGGPRWAGPGPPPGLPQNTLWSGRVPTRRALVRRVTLGLEEPKPQVGSLRGAPRGLRVAGPLHGLRKPFLFHCSRPAASQPRPPLTSLCPRTRSLRPSPAPASGSRPTPRLSMLQPLSSPGRSLPRTHPDRGGRLKKNFLLICVCKKQPPQRLLLWPTSWRHQENVSEVCVLLPSPGTCEARRGQDQWRGQSPR